LKTAQWIRDEGGIPFIRLMFRSDAVQNHAEPTFLLNRILIGDFDPDLRAWAQAARDFDSPLIVEFGTEVNGAWFSWNGKWYGEGTTDKYGDPSEPDGAELFKDTYRHIIEIYHNEGADNITWVFHVNWNDLPEESWNRLEKYYPGDDWIDWIGVSMYGAQTPIDTEFLPFREMMDAVYPRLEALSSNKPIVLLEFGATSGNSHGDQAAWAQAAFNDLFSLRWKRIIGFSWWNDNWENDDYPKHNTDMRVQSNPALTAVFRRMVGDNPQVIGRLEIPYRR
jgi:beta-mannanase